MDALSKLSELEATIANGIETFLDVGNALKQIRDDNLYRTGYETFNEYVRERWGWEKTYAYRLIKVAEVDAALPIGNSKPSTESQFREVAKAPPEKQAEVVEAANQRAAEQNRKPTAKDFAEARHEVCNEKQQQQAMQEYEDVGEAHEEAYDSATVLCFTTCQYRLSTLRQIVLFELTEVEREILKSWIAG